MDKSDSWQPKDCRPSVQFLNWAMHRCAFGRDTLRQHFHNDAKHLLVVVAHWLSLIKDCMTYHALCWCGGRTQKSWCGRHTIHIGVIEKRETNNISYIQKRSNGFKQTKKKRIR